MKMFFQGRSDKLHTRPQPKPAKQPRGMTQAAGARPRERRTVIK